MHGYHWVPKVTGTVFYIEIMRVYGTRIWNYSNLPFGRTIETTIYVYGLKVLSASYSVQWFYRQAPGIFQYYSLMNVYVSILLHFQHSSRPGHCPEIT